MMASLTTGTSTAGFNSNVGMKILALLTLLFSLVTCETTLSTEGASANSKTYTLFHDVDGSGKFIPRSLITLSSSDNGSDSTVSRTPETSSNREAGAVSITIENVGEQCVNMTSFGTGLCRLKLVDDVGHEAISAVSFCSMRRSLNLVKHQFREKLEIMVTSTGDLLSFSMTPIISPLAQPCAELVKQPLSKGGNDVCFTFNTQVTVEGATAATSVPLVLPASRPPPGLLFFPTAKLGVNGDPSQQEGQQQQQHKSFFVRYWYIILPLFIMTCLTSGEEPTPPTSSSSTARTTSTNTATSTTTSSEAHFVRTAVAPPVPQPKITTSVKRRGKRD